ncbi:MAG TPA: lipoxygenase family protein [Pyrinomonadaceae bacterium]|nr:lipoxygenase family protein [Pyrinomonadaceae bacterium]
MLSLSQIVDQLFTCLGPLRGCQEPIQDRCVDPLQEYVIDPVTERCVDPVLSYLEVNPLGCLPVIGIQPSLPQFDSSTEQEERVEQLGRTQQNFQYNYSLVRTFKRNGKDVGVQGKGIAVADSVAFSQLPSICWILPVLQHALSIIDNLLAVLELVEQPSRREQRALVSAKSSTVAVADDEADLVTKNLDISPEELERSRRGLLELRGNLAGTLGWGRTLAKSIQGKSEAPPTLRALAPVQESETSTGAGSLCPCPQCSPQAITKKIVDDIKAELSKIVEQILYLPLNRRPRSIKAYNDLFQIIPLPHFALTFRSDEVFALQRIAGQNPVVIKKLEWNAAWEKKFPVTNAQFKQVMGDDDSLKAASEEDRLYVCDYSESLNNSIAGKFPFDRQKYINVPLALFALSKADRNVIKAVAIQAGQEPGTDYPVITPDCEWNWQIAKTIVQNADCNDSEYYRHLGLAHLLTEAFVLATYRQLPRQHPLYALLTPHFAGTLFTNNTAVTSILDEGSFLNITEAIFSGTVPSTLGIAANAVSSVNFTENMLINELRSRGVDDPIAFPNYPYREDALLIWKAIHGWVTDYVRLYYRSDADVTEDYELQLWVTEVSSRQGGRIKGVGDGGVGGRIATMSYLIDCLTQVIYTASAHHALTNFPLEDIELYEPGWPGALYEKPPRKAKGASRTDWLSYLSPLNIALLQQALGFTVGGVYYTTLGDYPLCNFSDSRVRTPLRAFQDELSRVEDIIRKRNQARTMPYPYLLPSRIPQSTNI